MFRPTSAGITALLFLLAGCASAGVESPATTPPSTSPTTTPAPSTSTSAPPPPVTAPEATDTWVRVFAGPGYGALFDVVLTPDGEMLAVGATNHVHLPPYSSDALLMKLTLEGEVVWERTWGGDGYEQALAAAPAEEGGFYVFGETDSHGAGGRDFFLMKTASDGSEEWFRTYGRPGREWPYGMLPLANGDLLIYGFTETPAAERRSQYAARVGADGTPLWEYVGEGTEDELILDALETVEGDLVLAVSMAEDPALVRLDGDGRIQWAKRYELPGWQYATGLAPTDSGGFLLAGFSMSPGSADTWLARCTGTGELEWETSFGDPAFDDYATSMIRLGDGTYLLGAIADGLSLSRVDGEGTVLWRRFLVGQAVHGAMALAELGDGGFLVAGLVQLIPGRSYDAILLRTDPEGEVAE